MGPYGVAKRVADRVGQNCGGQGKEFEGAIALVWEFSTYLMPFTPPLESASVVERIVFLSRVETA